MSNTLKRNPVKAFNIGMTMQRVAKASQKVYPDLAFEPFALSQAF